MLIGLLLISNLQNFTACHDKKVNYNPKTVLRCETKALYAITQALVEYGNLYSASASHIERGRADFGTQTHYIVRIQRGRV